MSFLHISHSRGNVTTRAHSHNFSYTDAGTHCEETKQLLVAISRITRGGITDHTF